MRMHVANVAQSLGLIRSSLQTRATFSSCLLTHDSPRNSSALPSIKTFQIIGSPLKPSIDTHPTKRSSSNLRSITEQPDNGSQDSTSTIQSSQPIGICEAHHTFSTQYDEKTASANSSTIQHSIGISVRNGSRTGHGPLESRAHLEIKMTPAFSSDEPSKNCTQIATIAIKPQILPKISELEFCDRKIHLASYAVQKRGDGLRIRLRLTLSGTLNRRNERQEFLHQAGNHTQEKDIPHTKTEVNNAVSRETKPFISDLTTHDQDSSHCWRHSEPTARRHEEESDNKTKAIIHQPIGPNRESLDHPIHPDSRALQSSISPVRKVFLWTPWKYSDLFYPAIGDEKKQFIGKMQSDISRPRYTHDESSLSFWHLDLRTIRYSDGDKSIDSPDRFSLAWKRRYAIIVQGIWTLQPWKGISNLTWESLITPDMDGKAIFEAWSKFPGEEPDVVWREFMLWALQHNPEIALKVLDVTMSERVFYIPKYALVDVLAYLTSFYLKGSVKRRSKEPKPRDLSKLDQILRLTCNLIENPQFRETRHAAFFDDRMLDLVLFRCKPHQVPTLWDTLVAHGIKLHPLTLDLSLKKFEKIPDRLRSVDVLHRLYHTPNIFDYQLRAKLLMYLRITPSDENWFEIQAQVWDRIVRTGIRLSSRIYTAMIKSCVEANQRDAALALYGQARGQQLIPRAATYTYLLNGFERGWGSDVLDLVIRDADTDGMLHTSHTLVYKILLAKSHLDFPELLEFYGRYYDLAPLYTFGIVKRGQFLLQPHVWSRQPSSRVLGLMLLQCMKQNPISPEVVGLCNNYHALLRGGNYYALHLARSDYVPNYFIWAFGKRPGTLDLCLIVIRAMLSSEPPRPAGFPQPSIKIQRPTVITWTLLLQSFCRHRQMVAAEKVLTMMRDRGVEPNEITWMTLILGYSAAQDIDGAMSAVKRMEAAGIPVGNYVVEALAPYRDREKILERLDDAIKPDSNLQTDGWEDQGKRNLGGHIWVQKKKEEEKKKRKEEVKREMKKREMKNTKEEKKKRRKEKKKKLKEERKKKEKEEKKKEEKEEKEKKTKNEKVKKVEKKIEEEKRENKGIRKEKKNPKKQKRKSKEVKIKTNTEEDDKKRKTEKEKKGCTEEEKQKHEQENKYKMKQKKKVKKWTRMWKKPKTKTQQKNNQGNQE